ncbi:hypothetical protein [Bacteriovorax sp. DB6_IX]|uniref:hypothetical protein n=1 Tax=Bacteriovorax sp. DB6_IX TaxID=1353530 RepID=UPI00038A09A9|nr:hypothetical protein [Bacteriovorax sp. DB6_IX]EQC44103.1 hypothetical protein M901_0642 [Bacteriovorax sp. DB6_IX]
MSPPEGYEWNHSPSDSTEIHTEKLFYPPYFNDITGEEKLELDRVTDDDSELFNQGYQKGIYTKINTREE